MALVNGLTDPGVAWLMRKSSDASAPGSYFALCYLIEAFRTLVQLDRGALRAAHSRTIFSPTKPPTESTGHFPSSPAPKSLPKLKLEP